jgi:DNA-binding IclR family transcriptional regulator
MGKARAHHRTVDRVAELLEAAVTYPDGASLTQLARAVDAPVSSVQKLVDGLVAVGYLDESGRRYLLGPAPYVLSLRAGRRPVSAVRRGDLAALAERLAVPVLLAVRVGDDAVYVDWAGADEPFDYALSSRVRGPLPDTAAGRVLLAHLPEPLRREVVRTARPGDPAAAVALLAETERIRRTGRETGTSGPLLPGAVAVAVPVREADGDGGDVVAALAAADRTGALAARSDETAVVLAEAATAWERRAVREGTGSGLAGPA